MKREDKKKCTAQRNTVSVCVLTTRRPLFTVRGSWYTLSHSSAPSQRQHNLKRSIHALGSRAVLSQGCYLTINNQSCSLLDG